MISLRMANFNLVFWRNFYNKYRFFLAEVTLFSDYETTVLIAILIDIICIQ